MWSNSYNIIEPQENTSMNIHLCNKYLMHLFEKSKVELFKGLYDQQVSRNSPKVTQIITNYFIYQTIKDASYPGGEVGTLQPPALSTDDSSLGTKDLTAPL